MDLIVSLVFNVYWDVFYTNVSISDILSPLCYIIILKTMKDITRN